MIILKVTSATWGARNATVLVDNNNNHWVQLTVFPQSTGYLRLGDVAPQKDSPVKHYSPVPGSYRSANNVTLENPVGIPIAPLDDTMGIYAVAGIT